MSTNLNKAKAVRRGAITALIIITILMSGCGNPVGGVENNPLADFVGKTYKSQYNELFAVAAPDTIKLDFGTDYSTEGKIVASKSTDAGTVYLLECSTHSNHSPAQYPNFDETKPHSGCYLPVHVRSISANSVEWATFYTKVESKDTACFAAGSKDKATEYLDLTQWNPQPTTSTGTVQ